MNAVRRVAAHFRHETANGFDIWVKAALIRVGDRGKEQERKQDLHWSVLATAAGTN